MKARLTPAVISPARIDLIDDGVTTGTGNRVLKCRKCGDEFMIDLTATGAFPERWWVCPSGCNADVTEAPVPLTIADGLPG